MKLIERSVISAAPEKIWPFIISPERFQEWNDKIVSIGAREAFVPGQSFSTFYKMSGQSSQCLSVAVEIRPFRLLELKHTAVLSSKGRSNAEAVERITLVPEGAVTVVTKTVLIKDHGIPFIFLPFIWFVTRFGKRQGEDKLKTMCEKA